MFNRVLALDVATTTGFAFGDVGLLPPATDLEIAAQGGSKQPHSGSQRMGSKNSDNGMVFQKYREWLEDMITLHNPDVVVFEAPYMDNRFFNTAQRLFGMAGVTESVCAEKKVKCFSANIGRTRKYFCGTGNAKTKVIKKLVQDACDLRGWTYVDDNEADALGVWEYTAACLTGRITS